MTLTGTLDKQFDDWRRILREIYAAETGIEPPPEVPSQASGPADASPAEASGSAELPNQAEAPTPADASGSTEVPAPAESSSPASQSSTEN